MSSSSTSGISSRFKRSSGFAKFGAVMAAVLVILILGWFWAATIQSMPVDKIGLHYTGGPLQGTHFVEVIQPGTGVKYYGQFENIYELPSTQRNYIISKDPNAGDQKGVDFLSAPSSDNTPFTFEAATYFKINPKPKVIRTFFEQICLHDSCWDLSPGGGWDKMLAQYFRPQIENALRVEAEKYSRDDIYRDPKTLLAIQRAVGSDLKERISAAIGGEFFCGPDATASICPDFAFVLKNPTPPANVIEAYADNAATAQGVISSQNKAKAAVADAQGQSDSKVTNAKGDAEAQRIRAAAPPLSQSQLDYITAVAEQTCAASNGKCTLVITNGGTGINVNTK